MCSIDRSKVRHIKETRYYKVFRLDRQDNQLLRPCFIKSAPYRVGEWYDHSEQIKRNHARYKVDKFFGFCAFTHLWQAETYARTLLSYKRSKIVIHEITGKGMRKTGEFYISGRPVSVPVVEKMKIGKRVAKLSPLARMFPVEEQEKK